MRRTTMPLLGLLSMLSATACAPSTPVVVTKPSVEYVLPPPELLYCRHRPSPPPHDAIIGAWKVYAVLLHAWGSDCEGKLSGDAGSVAAWVHAHMPVVHK